MSDWNPASPVAWGRLLGMVPVPLFGRARRATVPGEHSLLLDGPTASVGLSIGDAQSILAREDSLSWIWSPNLRYSIIVDPNARRRFVRRWDDPSDIEEGVQPDAREAFELVDSLARRPKPIAATVIEKMLGIFRQVRNNFDQRGGTDRDTIRAFNAMLMWAHATQRGDIDPIREGRPSTIRDILPILGRHQIIGLQAETFSPSVRSFPIGDLLDAIVERDPATNLVLDPDLFIRHAAGSLYQEGHRELGRRPTRSSVQMLLSFESDNFTLDDSPARGTAQRDAHFTPSSLARTLVQEAIREIGRIRRLPTTLKILDPACGSGVFLVEAAREVSAEYPEKQLRLIGFDKSAVACIMTKFCASRASEDEGVASRTTKVFRRDSLEEGSAWDNPDIILMNPPFIPWQRMSEPDRANVRRILADTPARLPDLYLAFVAKALTSLKAGAVLASVVPTSFLNGDAAERLRAAIQADDTLTVRLIGRFRDLNFFRGALVEPAIIVIARLTGRRHEHDGSLAFLLAEQGREDDALRAFRRGDSRGTLATHGWEIRRIPKQALNPSNWLPLSAQPESLIAEMEEAGVPTVSDLFNVHLNVQTGDKTVFVVRENELSSFSNDPGFEYLFRPVADEIREGNIISRSFVFFPYDASGNRLEYSDSELESLLPRFYSERLLPKKKTLGDRPAVQGHPWWSLNRGRADWAVGVPKLVTPQFGARGTFAYDDSGRYVVLQGNAWLWRSGRFDLTALPWAYLALLNSRIFEALMGLICPRVQGGQFNVNKKYVGEVRIPRLSDDSGRGDTATSELAEMGRSIGSGVWPDPDALDRAVAAAYGIPLYRMIDAILPELSRERRDRFRLLASQWKLATSHLSNVATKIKHPAYQQIIAMGESIVPEILADLRREFSDWFPALTLITGESPIGEEIYGNVAEMTRAWLCWGETQGYIR